MSAIHPSLPFPMARGSMIPDALLASNKQGAGRRERLFSPLVTFWAFLSQGLSPNSACREAVRKVQAWWMLRAPLEMFPDTSAYCQARQRLSDEVRFRVGMILLHQLEKLRGSRGWYWGSAIVRGVSGDDPLRLKGGGGGGLEGVFQIAHRQMKRAAGIRGGYGRDIHESKQRLKKIPSAALQQVGAIRQRVPGHGRGSSAFGPA